MGTPEALTQAAEFIRSIQDRQDILIGSPELMALKKNFISKKQIKNIQYLKNLAFNNKVKKKLNPS